MSVDPRHPHPHPEPLRGALSGACAFADQALPDPLPGEPFGVLAQWLAEAAERNAQPNPNAMTLATVGPDGAPSARVVLCRGMDQAAGTLTFYTNYHSRKGRQIESGGAVALVFHWDHLDRQARIEGAAVRVSAQESDAYFAGRPVLSRVAAWASDQSQPLGRRGQLFERQAAAEARFGVTGEPAGAQGEPLSQQQPRTDVPRPPHWGGYRVWARRVELWVGHTYRLHDRGLWERSLRPSSAPGAFEATAWATGRLQP
ncbi:MAG: pyridoxamine 5'-phosphate oxidase [Planctomyces sp.]|nr:pyridoxamine 5'-phosphate oxidase [Planctomyces sp.]